MNEWWKRPEFSDAFNIGQQSPQQVNAQIQQKAMAQAPAPQQGQGWSQQVGASNNTARMAIGQGPRNAAIDQQNKMAAAAKQQSNSLPGYTGAGPNGMIEPTKRVASADTHEGEFVLTADATQAIGPDVLQGLQNKASMGELDVNSLRSIIGQPTKQGFANGGLASFLDYKEQKAGGNTGPGYASFADGKGQSMPTYSSMYAGRGAGAGSSNTVTSNQPLQTNMIGGAAASNQRADRISNQIRVGQNIDNAPTVTTPTTTGTPVKTSTSSYTRTIGMMTPEEKAIAKARADQSWKWNEQGMNKIAGVAAGTDAMYAQEKNNLMQDIGGAGAAQVSASRQQAAQAGYSPEQLQSMGIQQQRAQLNDQSGHLADLSDEQQQRALDAAEALQTRAQTLQEYAEGSEKRALELAKTGLDLDVLDHDFKEQQKSEAGKNFQAAVTRMRLAGKSDEEIMADPSVRRFWGEYAPTQGYDANSMDILENNVHVAGMGLGETAWQNLVNDGGLPPNMTPDQIAKLESTVKLAATLGSIVTTNKDGSVFLDGELIGSGNKILQPSEILTATGSQIVEYTEATGGAKSFWENPNSKYFEPMKSALSKGTLTPAQSNVVASELNNWATAEGAHTANDFRGLSQQTKDFLRTNFPGEVPAVTTVATANGFMPPKDIINGIKDGTLTAVPANSLGIHRTKTGSNYTVGGLESSVGTLIEGPNGSIGYITGIVDGGKSEGGFAIQNVGVIFVNPDGTTSSASYDPDNIKNINAVQPVSLPERKFQIGPSGNRIYTE